MRSLKPSFWNSCRSIVQNLEDSYTEIFGDEFEVFDYSADQSLEEVENALNRYKKTTIKRIVFIDHYPTITNFLKVFNQLYPTDKPDLFIHTFGDFNIRTNEYLGIDELLKEFKLTLISPSTKSRRHIDFFLNKAGTSLVCPFPISNDFIFNKVDKEKLKSKYSIPIKSRVIVSYGRLSHQKNSLGTLLIVEEYLRLNPDSYYIIAGSFDEYGLPIIGNRSIQTELEKAIFRINKELGSRVIFLGEVEKEKILELLHLSDIYLSLSLYHTEDFGMAPLEALCCGLPCLLTDWGGYSDFYYSEKTESCSLVKVELNDNGLEISKEEVLSSLTAMLEKKTDREHISNFYREKYSIIAIGEQLAKNLCLEMSEFEGFNQNAKIFYWINKKGLELECKPNRLYEKMFRGFYEG